MKYDMNSKNPCSVIANQLGFSSWEAVVSEIREGATFSFSLPYLRGSNTTFESEFKNQLDLDQIVVVFEKDQRALMGSKENLPSTLIQEEDPPRLH